ncbi:MAG: alpha/beta hydrolase, partial [Acidobacteriaceae bacterium]|nr:alpha/beta hydrolase [Acidobacteriaceae bacterium]
GWSDAARGRRSTLNLTVELKTMLEAAGIEPPYVLVGHSFGAFIVQRFVDLYPEDVRGVVLLDPPQPEECSEIQKGIRLARCAEILAQLGLVRILIQLLTRKRLNPGNLASRVTRQVAKLPRGLWPAIAAHWCNPQFYRTAIAYLQALPATMKEMQTVAPLREDVRTVVITQRNKWNAAQWSFAENIRARKSGHWIHLDEPELVIEIVRDMVACEVAYLAH